MKLSKAMIEGLKWIKKGWPGYAAENTRNALIRRGLVKKIDYNWCEITPAGLAALEAEDK